MYIYVCICICICIYIYIYRWKIPALSVWCSLPSGNPFSGFWLFNQSWSLLIKYCASSTHQALKQRETQVDPVNKQIPARCGEGGRGRTFINRGWGLIENPVEASELATGALCLGKESVPGIVGMYRKLQSLLRHPILPQAYLYNKKNLPGFVGMNIESC